jgi:hypothetical protein
MLIVQSYLQRLLAIGIQRQQVVIFIGAPVQHAAPAVHGGVDDRSGNAAIFGLHVEHGSVHRYVCVVTEQHAYRHLSHDRGKYCPQIIFRSRI